MGNSFDFLDDIDLEILSRLQKNGKLTAKNLADEIELTQTPVYERIKKLEKTGVIQRYVALLNPELVDVNLVVFMNISVHKHEPSSRTSLTSKLSLLDEVVELYHTTGQFDFVAKVRVPDIESYKNLLLEKVTSLENIKDIVSHIVLEDIKYSTVIPIKR